MKTVEDAYAEEFECNQSLQSRVDELETALAGLCDAIGKTEDDAWSWSSGDMGSPHGYETELVYAWLKARKALDPS